MDSFSIVTWVNPCRERRLATLGSWSVTMAVCMFSVLVSTPPAYSQDNSSRRSDLLSGQDLTGEQASPVEDPVSIEVVERELKNVTAAELPEEVKTAAVSYYQAARQTLADAEIERNKASDFKSQAEQASTAIDKARTKLDESTSKSSLPFNETTPLKSNDPDVKVLPSRESLENLALEKKAILKSLESDKLKLVNLPGERRVIQSAIPELTAAAEKERTKIERQLSTTAPGAENPLVTRGRLVEQQANLKLVNAKLDRYWFENQAYDANTGLPEIEEDIVSKEIIQVENEIKVIETCIGLRQLDEVKELAKAKDVSPELREIHAENSELANKLRARIGLLAQVKAFGREANSNQRDMVDEFKQSETRVKEVGLSSALGKWLRRDKTDLITSRRKAQQNLRLSNDQELVISQAEAQSQIDRFNWEDQLKDLDDREQIIESKLALLKSAVDKQFAADQKLAPDSQTIANLQEVADRNRKRVGGLGSEMDELLQQREELLSKLVNIEGDLFKSLLALDASRSRLLETSREYTDFIDQHILWVRSTPLIGQDDAEGVSESTALLGAANWLTLPANWKQCGQAIYRNSLERLPTLALVLIGLLGLFVFQPHVRKELRNVGEQAAKRGCRRFSPTLNAIVHTCLLAMTWPAIGLALGWLLRSASPELFPEAIGRGLTITSLIAIPFELLRWTCRDNGLAQCHFDWTETFRLALQKNLRWLVPIGAPLILLIVAIQFSDKESSARLGRIAMLALLVLSSVFFYRVFRPGAAIYNEVTASQISGYFYRLRHLIYLGVMLGHAVLFVFAVLGYYYSVYVIGNSLIQTATLAVVAIILYAIAMRFLLVRRRNLRYEQLIQQRNQARLLAQKQAELGESAASPAEILDIDLQYESGLDITNVSRQARELTGVIFFTVIGLVLLALWQYLLPATKILDGWELWRVTIGSAVESVTARDLLISSIIFAITFFGVRNIPGMLELLLLQRLPMDSGARYAVTSILRYILLVVGVIIALSFLKIPWSKYSWLVAAISVGLGFGLQEIVANFVSGLILLLERPVRVGDVVTIDGVTGVVSRIQMRATTVTNWDNQELVVPNKDLISGKLLNWTLSSVVNRLAFKFGVAYGSDVKKVREIAMKIVDEHPGVLKEPVPFVTFEAFGDSSLNFTIRCCTKAIEKKWVLINDVNSSIHEELNKAGIEIPFPQREVRILENK